MIMLNPYLLWAFWSNRRYWGGSYACPICAGIMKLREIKQLDRFGSTQDFSELKYPLFVFYDVIMTENNGKQKKVQLFLKNC